MDKKYIHGSLVVDGDILEEFKSKRAELQRRLKSNQFNPDGYELMNDRQQDVFITGIFVDPMQAEGIDNYIEFGYDNCECPDVMDELYETCPALMSKVDKFKDRKDAQTRVTIEYLDRMMDMVIQEHLLTEATPAKMTNPAQEYEQQCLNAMIANNVCGKPKIADASENGPDAEIIIDGKPYKVEIKLNLFAQMGDATLKYFPGEKKFVPSEKFDDDTQAAIVTGMKQIEDDVINWIEFLRDPRYPNSEKWVDTNKDALGSFGTTFEKYKESVRNKMLNKISTGFGADFVDKITGQTIERVKIPIKSNIIAQMYANKKEPTYYIQIGGKGLYVLNKSVNPAKLPVPEFKGVISLETRVKPSGTPKDSYDTSKGKLTVNSKEDGTGKDITFMPFYEPKLGADGKPIYTYASKNKTQFNATIKLKKGDIEYQKIQAKGARKDEIIPAYEPVLTKVKPKEDPDNLGSYTRVTGQYMSSARFLTPDKGGPELPESPFTLDDPKSVNNMLAKMGQTATPSAISDPNLLGKSGKDPRRSGVPDLAGFSAELDKFNKKSADSIARLKAEKEKAAAKAAKKKK